MERIRKDNQQAVREEVEKRGEVEELRARVMILERRRSELVEELEKAEERSKVQEQDKLKALQTGRHMLARKMEEVEKDWRSRVEETDMKLEEARREVQESRTELNRVRALLEEHRTQISSQAAEKKEEQNNTDGQRRQIVQGGGGAVSIQWYSLLLILLKEVSCPVFIFFVGEDFSAAGEPADEEVPPGETS